MTKCGVMQFVATDLEVPLRTIQRVRGKIVKSSYSLYQGNRAVHVWLKSDRIPTRDLCPSFVEAALIEKNHGEILHLMAFNISLLHTGAPHQGEDQECQDDAVGEKS